MNLNDSVSSIRNVGGRRLAALGALSIRTVQDLLEYYPRDYLDRSVLTPIAELSLGRTFTIKAVPSGELQIRRAGSVVMTTGRFSDESGEITVNWFNQPYLRDYFKRGEEYILTGAVSEWMNAPRMQSPEYILAGKKRAEFGIEPIYRGIRPLSQKQLREYIHSALEGLEDGELAEFLPAPLLEKYKLASYAFAIRNIHFPKDGDSFYAARRRLAFDELLAARLSLSRIRREIRKERGFVLPAPELADFCALLGFELTDGQKSAISDVFADFARGTRSNRLIQGDVGSGKTVVAMAACLAAIRGGCQAALMAPTDVLAGQHFAGFSEIFGKLGISVVLLSGSLGAKEKKAALAQIAGGEAQMIIGTHALIQKGVEFAALALAITDEQHRFGVDQRVSLSRNEAAKSAEAPLPHVLVMTATPIPRTLALILYGDLNISTIRELPPGRQKITTYFVTSSYRARLDAFFDKEIAEGRQIYVICPMISDDGEASASSELKNVTAYAEELRKRLPSRRVAALHGRLKPAEKREIMLRFSGREIDILVATTVIEVGVNVPNATVMMIENAERFGLSQLHQLRGRVGRGGHRSYCVLMSDSKGGAARERLAAMTKISDGFELSDLDLKLRGPGDFFGTRQHGIPEFRLANLYSDIELAELAGEAAESLGAAEPEAVKRRVDRFFGRFETNSL